MSTTVERASRRLGRRRRRADGPDGSGTDGSSPALKAFLARGLGEGGWNAPMTLTIIAITVVLLVLGLVMTFSASFVESTVRNSGDAFHIFVRQAIWAGVGLPLAIVAAVVDYRAWRRFTLVAVLATMAALVAVLVIGEEINGARRWFSIGPASIQPAEIIKLTLPLWCAHVIARRWDRIRRGDLWALLGPTAPLTLMAAGLVSLGPDLESAVLVAAIGLTAVIVAGLPLRVLALGGALVTTFATWSVLTTPYRIGRFQAWLDPTAYADTFGYQTTQGFIALGRGGLWGVGLGQGRGKWLYIPNAHTDFIYAIVGEELGLVGAMALLLAFAALAIVGVRIARSAPDMFGRLLAVGITAWLTLQAAINISSVVGLLPVTGVTLPLVSFGGSSLMITLAGLGLLISIARQGAIATAAAEATSGGDNGLAGLDVTDVEDLADLDGRLTRARATRQPLPRSDVD